MFLEKVNSDLPWIIGCIYKEYRCFDLCGHVLGKKTLQKLFWSISNTKEVLHLKHLLLTNLPALVRVLKYKMKANSLLSPKIKKKVQIVSANVRKNSNVSSKWKVLVYVFTLVFQRKVVKQYQEHFGHSIIIEKEWVHVFEQLDCRIVRCVMLRRQPFCCTTIRYWSLNYFRKEFRKK